MTDLSEAQIEQFERDGVICLRDVLSEQDVSGLSGAVDQQMQALGESRSGYDLQAIADQVWSNASKVDTKSATRFDLEKVKVGVLSDKDARPLMEDGEAEGKGMFFYDAAGWKQYEAIRKVAFDSSLPELMSGLLRSHRLHFWEDTTFVKRPGTRQKTVFHQDKGYFQISGQQCVIVWIPLDPAGLENGTLQYVRGSHLSGEVYAPSVFFARSLRIGAKGKLVPDIEANPDAYDLISFNVEPGDVIVHHVNTIHGAGGNMSSRDRRAMSFRYCGDDIRYADDEAAVKQINLCDQLQDGDPLASEDYPLVWPKPWPSFPLSKAYAHFASGVHR